MVAQLFQMPKEVRELAELVDAPVCDSLMGKGKWMVTAKDITGMICIRTKTSNYGVTNVIYY